MTTPRATGQAFHLGDIVRVIAQGIFHGKKAEIADITTTKKGRQTFYWIQFEGDFISYAFEANELEYHTAPREEG